MGAERNILKPRLKTVEKRNLNGPFQILYLQKEL